MVLLENNTVMSFGKCCGPIKFDDYMRYSLPYQIVNQVEVKYLSAGHTHFLMLDINNQLWVTGDNNNGCLGT